MALPETPPVADPPQPDPAPPPDPEPPKGEPPEPEPADPEPPKGGEDEPIKADDDWQVKARKHEREAKKARERAEKAEQALKDREDADKSEHEKALDAARSEGEVKAREQYETERRRDRLEVATTRYASRGIQLGEGEEAETVKFADPDDALVHLERAIDKDEVDDPFDDEGKLDNNALQAALVDLLQRKPHLRAPSSTEPPPPPPPPKGDPDRGKGADGKKALEEMSVEEHLARIQAERRPDSE